MRLRNPRERGDILERKSRRRRELRGEFVVRAAGSHGLFDLVALDPDSRRVEFIQVKADRGPGPQEREALAALAGNMPGPCPHCGSEWRVIVERWLKYARQPDTMVCR